MQSPPSRLPHRAALAAMLSALLAPSLAQASPTYHMRVFSKGIRSAPVEPGPVTPTAALAFQTTDGSALASLAFPDTSVGSNSAPMSVTLKNTGNAELTFNSPPAFTAAPFSVADSTCNGTLVPEATCSVSVVFSPGAAQEFSGSLSTDSSIAAVSLPLSGTGTMAGVSQVITGTNQTFVQRSDGSWAATGMNSSGQMGLNDTVNRLVFTPVPALEGASQVIVNHGHTLAKLANGSWAATGANDLGQLGLNDTVNRLVFTPVPALAGASQVVGHALASHTFAKLADGSWAATGFNNTGQLGLNDTANRLAFTPVPALDGASQVVMSTQSTFARLSDGTWAATGQNSNLQLGLGDTLHFLSFTTVPELVGATQVSVGDGHTFARLSNGEWAATGFNFYGQLGLGDTVNRSRFTLVPGLAGATQVVGGGGLTFAKFSNGEWAAVGKNNGSQLGLGDSTTRYVFTSVPALAGASQVAVGTNHTVARFPNGEVAVVGLNTHGQLGLGDRTRRYSFTLAQP